MLFSPGGNNTSPSLMFLSLKLDIGGMNPQSSITLPLGVTINHLTKVINGNGEHAINHLAFLSNYCMFSVAIYYFGQVIYCNSKSTTRKRAIANINISGAL